MERIDVVIPWVDDQDDVWRQDRLKYLSDFNDEINSIDKFYRDWGTLLYVFRGIEKFMPWVGKIFLLTYGHIPHWLNVNHEKIQLLKHADFFLKASDLPTFSSPAIESNLIGIKGLADKFIYFNDDTLVLKNTPVDRFFKNNLPLDFIVDTIPRKGFLYRRFVSNDTFVDIILNCLRLINGKFSKHDLMMKRPSLFFNKSYGIVNIISNLFFCLCPHYVWFAPYHFQQPYLRKNIEDAHVFFRNELEQTSGHRFRDKQDISQALFRYTRLAQGEFEPYCPNDTLSIVLDSYKTFNKYRNKIKEIRFFSPNDSAKISQEDYIKTKLELQELLNEIMPDKSSFEI